MSVDMDMSSVGNPLHGLSDAILGGCGCNCGCGNGNDILNNRSFLYE